MSDGASKSLRMAPASVWSCLASAGLAKPLMVPGPVEVQVSSGVVRRSESQGPP